MDNATKSPSKGFFNLEGNHTNFRTELVAGLTTFMTMAYILAVNPDILSASGMPKGGVFLATALASIVGTVLMALWANYPFALAPGMGLNAFFAFTVCGAMGYSWQFALLAVFVEGLIFLILSLTPVREGIFNAIPFSLKKAVAVGIGFFITLIALKNAGIVVDNPATLVSMRNFAHGGFHTVGIRAVLAFVGIILTAVMAVKNVKGAILIGIFLTWILGIICEATGLARVDIANQAFPIIPHFGNYLQDLGNTFKEFGTTFGALFNPASWTHSVDGAVTASGWTLVKSLEFFTVMFAFFFVDLFDTLGTLIGVSLKGGFLDKEGKLPRINGALCSDAVATSVGAVFGTSTTTTFVESASGVAAGGKTGLTGIVVAVLFFLSILFAPIFKAIPSFATTPALVIVGFYMMQQVGEIDFNDLGEAIPAFLCIIAMPFTYSISEGIMWGVISYTLINLFTGKAKKVTPIMYILAIVFIAKYALM